MSELLDTIKARFKLAQEAEQAQREREKDDLRFQVPEEQWDDVSRNQRMGTIENGVPVPARPMLSISKLDQPRQLILNQARQARLGVQVHPVSEDSDKDGADIRQGLYRRIERDSNADQARLWALDRAVQCGRGAYRVSTKWDEDSDPKYFDQEIIIERILHQECVYFDPAATKADYSDGEWAFVVEWMSLDKFKRLFPKSKIADTDVDDKLEWESLETEAPDWVRVEGDTKSIQVAEHWYKEHEFKELKGPKGQKRELDRVTVKVCKLVGTEILEESEWNGHYIPLVPVHGRELQPYDGERRWFGMTSTAKDGQRFYNYAASNFAERMGLEPKAPWVVAEGQDENYEDMWRQANVRNFPSLKYKPTTVAGLLVPPPARAQLDSQGMSLSMMAMQEADRFIQATTSVYDPSLGRESSRDKSGKAILALQQQSDAGTSHFLASLADVSMPLEARIVLDLMPAIYDRPGRVTTILRGDDDESEPVMLGMPFMKDQQTGQPMPALMQPGMPMPQGAKEYDLSKGAYSVSVTIGKSFQTRLQQGADEMGQILSADPTLMPMIGDLYFRFRDFPGATEIADRLAKIREKQFPGLGEGEDGQIPPEQMQAQMQAAKQEIQQLQQQLQMAIQAIETDKAKQQVTLQKTDMDNRTKLEQSRMDNAVKVQIAELQAKVDLALAEMKASMEQMRVAMGGRMAAEEGERQRGHEAMMAIAGPGLEEPEPPEQSA